MHALEAAIYRIGRMRETAEDLSREETQELKSEIPFDIPIRLRGIQEPQTETLKPSDHTPD